MTQYILQMWTLPFICEQPSLTDSGQEGLVVIIADRQTPDITSQIPEGTQFFLSPWGDIGQGEDPSITRTCTSSFYDAQTSSNLFTFTPLPRNEQGQPGSWSALARLSILKASNPVPPPAAISFLASTPTPGANLIAACVQTCDAEGAPQVNLATPSSTT
jgi:hypothetical protein